MNYIKLSCVFESGDPEVASDIIIAELNEYGFESYENTEISVIAYIKELDFSSAVIEKLKNLNYPQLKIQKVSTENIEPQNWNNEWEKNFSPVRINKQCIIRASFHKNLPKVKYNIIIEPKMSFGTGHHETTFLMMNEIFKLDLKNKKVLDVGCGTGVLSILASKLKAAFIDAIDIDDWACKNTIENCEVNNCGNIKVIKSSIVDFSGNEYEVVLANINLNVIIDSIPKYTKLLKNGGYLMASGFYLEDIERLIKIALFNKLNVVSSSSKNNWAVCVFRKD